MKIIWNNIQITLYNWVSSKTGITTIWSDITSPQAKPPFVILKIISGPSMQGSDDEMSYDETTGFFYNITRREFTLSVQTFGKDSLQIMNDLIDTLADPAVQQGFRANKIAIINRPSIIDLTVMLESTHETRHAADMIFNVVGSIDLIGLTSIDKATITGTLNNREVIIDTNN